jgi:hypothetical protein
VSKLFIERLDDQGPEVLERALKKQDGRILIGGDTTDSTFDDTPKGTRTTIVLKPGSPEHPVFCLAG